MNIRPDCFKLAIVPPHKQIIQNLVIKLLDQSDNLLPEICSNFNFIQKLEVNLNNYALNFENLPQSEHVLKVEELVIRKNKFLFYPLVNMVSNLTTLKVYFKEFTFELQDLNALQQLRHIEINC